MSEQRRLVILCEGRSEAEFVNCLLTEQLAPRIVTPMTIPTSQTQKGGALSYERVRRAIVGCLRDATTIVTTFFDLYALPPSFPGMDTYRQGDHDRELPKVVESLRNDIALHANDDAHRFIPYIQPHEFEGLLFSDVTAFSRVNPDWNASITSLRAIREAATTPEHINHGYETRPSRRIMASCRGYHKVVHGSMLAAAIGIHTIEQECPSFNAWSDTLRRTT